MTITTGCIVKVFLKGGHHPHYNCAKVVSIDRDTVEIKPFGRHRKTERVPMSKVRWSKKWNKKTT